MSGRAAYRQSVVFAAVLGIVCAALMTAMTRFTGPYREANEKAEKVRAVLSVLNVPVSEKAAAGDLLKVFESNVREARDGDRHSYVYAPAESGGKVLAIAIPFEGQGLWGPIAGFLALEADMTTIRGFQIFHQEETPGLGSDIALPGFGAQFRGKSIRDSSGRPGLWVRKKGNASGANEVDGITGATMTCDKLTKILNDTVQKIPKEAP